jgi:hypothetical protein
MADLASIIHHLAGFTITFGSKVGLAAMFLLPFAVSLSTSRGERVFALYTNASTATAGILIAWLLAEFLRAVAVG